MPALPQAGRPVTGALGEPVGHRNRPDPSHGHGVAGGAEPLHEGQAIVPGCGEPPAEAGTPRRLTTAEAS